MLATGFRNPDGIGAVCRRRVHRSVQRRRLDTRLDDLPASSRRRRRNPPPLRLSADRSNGQPPALPLVYLPRGLDNSSGGQVAVPDDRWGPLQGQLHSFLVRPGNAVPGAARRSRRPAARCGRAAARASFARACIAADSIRSDGQLYVSGMAGWGTYTPDDGCFQRVRYTGEPVQLPSRFTCTRTACCISFTQPVDQRPSPKLHEPLRPGLELSLQPRLRLAGTCAEPSRRRGARAA